MDFRVFPTLEDLSRAAGNIFIELRETEGENIFIVPGGKTPRLFYQNLAREPINWSTTTLVISDERLVEEDSLNSNIGMIRANLLDPIPNDFTPNLIPVVNGFNQTDSNKILHSLNSATQSLLPPKAAFLGIGSDGHTASLFPGFEEISVTDAPFILVKRSSESFKRVSVSAQVLHETQILVFLVSGQSKAPVIQRLANPLNSPDSLPVEGIINHNIGRVTILCDRDAAPQLKS